MKVLVNGVGNIGTTILNILCKYQNELGISKVYALKNAPNAWNKNDLSILQEKGVIICTTTSDEHRDFDAVKNEIQYVFDCTNNGGSVKNKSFYEKLPSLLGASAQGSEKTFGTSFMTGVNNQIIANEKYAHIVSCNTHSIATILTTLLGNNFDDLDYADFVIVRRSEDIGNHERLVSANVVARHLDPTLGTHHSIDVLDLFKTVDVKIDVTSSDITTPSQLMHGVRFNLKFKSSKTSQNHLKAWNSNPFIATTNKFDSNVIFELGRRYGFSGRIYSHAVVVANNVLVTDKSVKGWAFIPQEGNTIISTIHSFLLQTKNVNEEKVMNLLKSELLRKEW